MALLFLSSLGDPPGWKAWQRNSISISLPGPWAPQARVWEQCMHSRWALESKQGQPGFVVGYAAVMCFWMSQPGLDAEGKVIPLHFLLKGQEGVALRIEAPFPGLCLSFSGVSYSLEIFICALQTRSTISKGIWGTMVYWSLPHTRILPPVPISEDSSFTFVKANGIILNKSLDLTFGNSWLWPEVSLPTPILSLYFSGFFSKLR